MQLCAVQLPMNFCRLEKRSQFYPQWSTYRVYRTIRGEVVCRSESGGNRWTSERVKCDKNKQLVRQAKHHDMERSSGCFSISAFLLTIFYSLSGEPIKTKISMRKRWDDVPGNGAARCPCCSLPVPLMSELFLLLRRLLLLLLLDCVCTRRRSRADIRSSISQ